MLHRVSDCLAEAKHRWVWSQDLLFRKDPRQHRASDAGATYGGETYANGNMAEDETDFFLLDVAVLVEVVAAGQSEGRGSILHVEDQLDLGF